MVSVFTLSACENQYYLGNWYYPSTSKKNQPRRRLDKMEPIQCKPQKTGGEASNSPHPTRGELVVLNGCIGQRNTDRFLALFRLLNLQILKESPSPGER